MTAQRQQQFRISPSSPFRRGIAAIGLLVAAFAVHVGAARAATTERIVTNRFTGLAIDGFDPVAYFTQREPMMGLQDFEAGQGGAIWRFRNDSNRVFFLANPEIYGPQFGGYDPVDVARGVTVAGNPRLWVIFGQRLFLFSREKARDAFAAHPDRYLKQAMARWPALERDLSR